MTATKATLLLLATLAGCGTSPPVQLYQLRADPPGLVAAPASSGAATWALGPVVLPDYLDRDAIVRTSGQASLVSNPGERWAESLRDAVPRLLQQDLARLRGSDSVWRLPLPPGVAAARQLRVEIQRLDADSSGRSVVLQARWTLIDSSGASKPVVAERRIDVAVTGNDTDALVSAHRSALWQLAQAIAGQP
ncbi:PqiC family protein [Pelomonas sp. SE-A7]|uniref:PqiC family protein n=1 Tax=Pelomonas sp. SE-A7 TaxID=3054953 RepID=UPI00259D0CE3|nr:PqiC family protein [Pelomonas sp. SE-A7]MDM4764995.1 PqiC family protein [Pelomonas sp. SE-A7]